MKTGKDEEKVMGPMFPRLHVNDTEKGGPRAPPRNKMALYEQLSIPFQRFNKHNLVPVNSNNTASLIPPSASQGGPQQRSMLFSHQLLPLRQVDEKTDGCNFESSAPLMQLELRKKLEEDDFTVPIFMESNMGQDCGRTRSNVDREKVYPSSRASTPHSSKHLTSSNDALRQMPNIGPTFRQESRSHHNEGNLEEFVPSQEQSIKAVSNSYMNNNEVALRQHNTSLCHEPGDNPANNCSRLQKSDHSLLQEHTAACDPTSRTIEDAILHESSRGKNNGNSSITVWDYHSEEQRTLDDTLSREERTCRSLQAGVAERGDATSETSMVDSVSGMDVTPDDVVGVIGQKHFWKARRAIVNQQRVFAVQVFELHRLIKVQKLIAGSPHLLLEDNSFLAKPIKISSAKKLPLEYIVKGTPNAAKLKNDSEKPNHKMECSAENTVGKASLSSVQNGSQLPSYRTLSESSPVTPLTGNPNLGSWGFHQSPGNHQWLVPVMSPSEGLVFKPYPGPGYMAPSCGGCGPPGAMPMMVNFFNPACGIPSSHHYQGMGVPPFAAPMGTHGYFPPYGMPVLNQAAVTGSAVDQTNHLAASGFHPKSPGTGVNSNIQHQNSSNLPSLKKNGVIPDVIKVDVTRDTEVQVSTASSPGGRVQGIARGNSLEGNNMLSLFPISPIIDASKNDAQPQDIDLPPPVIKVVPHNGRSATESAARIFQSIQEERKQYDSA